MLVKGVVTDDRTAKPIKGVKVGIAVNRPGVRFDFERGAVTDDQGRFEFRGFPSDGFIIVHEAYWTREFGTQGHPLDWHLVDPAAGPGGEITFHLTMSIGPAITGTVLDAAGKPVKGAKVGAVVHRPAREVDYEHGTVTDAQGRFEFHGNPLDGIGVWHERYWPKETGKLRSSSNCHYIDPEAGYRGGVEFTVTLSSGPDFVGTIRDIDGKPIQGAAVSSGGKSATTDAQGVFVVHSPQLGAQGQAWLYVDAKGFIPVEISTMLPSAKPQSVIMERPYELLILAQTPTGEPIKDFIAGVVIPESTAMGFSPKSIEAKPGQVRMVFHSPGARIVWASAKGYATAAIPVDVVRNLAGVVVKFSAGVSVSGKAKVADGKFAGGEAILSFTGKVNAPVLKTPLKSDGSYIFEHVGPGEFDLKITIPGKTDAKCAVAVGNADMEVPATQVHGTGVVAGLAIYYQSDAPWPNTDGYIWSEDGKTFDFKTDNDGRFRVEGVTVGKATVSVGVQHGCVRDSVLAEVEVLEGKTVEVKLVPPAASQPSTEPDAP